MSSRSRHTVPFSAYQVSKQKHSRLPARGLQHLPIQDSFSSTSMADIVPQHYALSSDSSYGRERHSSDYDYLDSDRPYYHDQGNYQVLSQSMHGGFSMNLADCPYSEAMTTSSAGYDTSIPFSNGSSSLYNPMNAGRHQVYDDQDLSSQTLLPMDSNEYDASLTSSSFSSSGSRHTEWKTGLPTPPMDGARHVDRITLDPGYTLPNAAIGAPQWNRHDVLPAEEVDMFDFFDQPQPPRFSESRHTVTQQRPLRSASERKDHSGDEPSPTDSSRSKDSNQDKKKPRSDQLYEAKPGADGLYICPFAAMEYCQHKPTKQKCIYDKNLDSHLKPYKCTAKECQDVSFSSNACLFRHEREAHGLHGHNAHLCVWKNCERSQPGNGFPRRWNLGDHMKRVHGFDMTNTGSSEDRRAKNGTSKKRGSPPTTSVQMRRATSSREKAPAGSATLSRDERHTYRPSVNVTKPYRSHQVCSVSEPYEVQVQGSYEVMFAQQSRHSQPYLYNTQLTVY